MATSPHERVPAATILIAEDDPLLSSLLEKALRANGFATVVAADGEEAERLSLTGLFDLLILDIGLPRRSGLEVLRRLRARGEWLPVLVVTGQSDRADDAVIEAYADEFMSKPIGFKQLVSWVQALLDATA